MASYFARHELDKRGHDWRNEENPSAGYVAWLLWGREPGRNCAEMTKARLQEAEEKG